MSTQTLRPLALGELLDVAFGLYRASFPALVLVALLTSGLPSILQSFAMASGGLAENPLFLLGTLIVSVVFAAIGIGATTFIVSDHYLGESITAGAALGRAARFVGPLIVLSFLATFVVGVGILFFVIPGLILACGLAVSAPSMVLERLNATGGMRRSWNLTRGFRWKVFGTLAVTAFLMFLPIMALGVVAAVLGAVAEGTLVGILLELAGIALGVLISPFFYVALTVLYYDLRIRKEAFDLERLAGELQQA